MAAGADVAIKVAGLSELRRNLKTVDSDLPKALRIAFNDVAGIVAADAQDKVPTRSGRARGSVRAASTQTAARVKGGGNRAPYYPWLDFGGRVGRRRSVRRPFLPRGRYIYDAYFRARESGRVQAAATRAVTDVIRRAGIEVD